MSTGLGLTPQGAARIYEDLKPAVDLFQPFAWPYLRLNYLLVNSTLTLDQFGLDIAEPTEQDRVLQGVDETRQAQVEAHARARMSAENYTRRIRSYRRGYHSDDVPRRPLLAINRVCLMQHGFGRTVDLDHDGSQYLLRQEANGRPDTAIIYGLGTPVLGLQ